MIEIHGFDLWAFPTQGRVISVNGVVKKNGSAVMGKGTAAQAKLWCPGIDEALGDLIKHSGNHVYRVGYQETELGEKVAIYSFPTKHKFYDWYADPGLIKQSALQLVERCDSDDMQHVTLPRVGCGNGGLTWELVKPILVPILDDRFHVVTPPKPILSYRQKREMWKKNAEARQKEPGMVLPPVDPDSVPF